MASSGIGTSRRNFLKSSTGLAVGASLANTLAIPRTVHAGANESLRVGLIGCGGRGTAAAENALNASKDNVLVAVGDAFPDAAERSVELLRRRESSQEQVLVDKDHVFSGFDAYKQVIDSGVDVVILAEPTHFRPQHLAYAVEAGKHSFVEKPIAVDAPGVRSIIDTCKKAEEKGLAVVSGLCWRYHPAVRETMRRIIEDKAIGDIVSIRSCYNAGSLWHRGDKPDWSRMEYEIRNWIYFCWLSGDHIVEQAVHSLDKSAWLQGDIQPLRAFGTGGRQQRTGSEYGDIYDHHTVFYEYPNNVHVSFMCRQQQDCSNYVDELVLGTKGSANILNFQIEGENPWKYSGADLNSINMYDIEHAELFKSIREGRPINNGQYMANSTMLGIMGRMCTYTGQELTWDQCFASEERLGPAEYAWSDNVPECKVPIPGRKGASKKPA
ncbi:MAG: Gfo/Idh/MocA family oxidoreductase [Planctomycetes bacterium]|nr:Gfo/Idh/MocA family oxidoreductase [Planctomycetota bacterium]